MSAGASAPVRDPEPGHGVRIALIWGVVTVVAVPVIVLLAGPHIPPFSGSVQSHDQHVANVLLTALATPVATFVWVYFGYSMVVFRQRGETIEDGPPIQGNARIQISWVVGTSALVLGLAIYGTFGLLGSASGAGGGQGPNPLAKPADVGKALEVQVIGQQWLWTFRYPAYGGVETPELVVPVGQEVAFHVTSLDVMHSFWAYELGVKADAVPGNDNVAYVKPLKVGSIQVRCAELCGLWHGHMTASGHVMTAADFAAWIAKQQQTYAGVTKVLPPYTHTYFPDPQRRAG